MYLNMDNESRLILFMALMLLVAALLVFIRSRKFVKSALVTEGIIESYGTCPDQAAGESSLCAKVCYSVGPVQYQLYMNVGIKNEYPIGRRINILYDKSDPSHAYVDSVMKLYFFEGILALIGLAMIFFVFAGN